MRIAGAFSITAIVFVLLYIMLDVPTAQQTQKIAEAFVQDLQSFTFVDESTQSLQPVICCVCDSMPTSPQWSEWVPLSTFKKLCKSCGLARNKLEAEQIYPSSLLQQYKANHQLLDMFVLSPKTYVKEDKVLVCKDCYTYLKETADKRGPSGTRRPPPNAIASGYLVGEAPPPLKLLSETELALVSGARIDCQSYVFFAGCHQQIRGWHTIYKNRPAANAMNLQQLVGCGLKGTIVVVLCGPFTTTQKALVMKQVQVRPAMVIAAFQWLKHHNYLYKDFEIPGEEDIPMPIIYDEK